MLPNANLAPVSTDAATVVSLCMDECSGNLISTCEVIAKVRARAPDIQHGDEELVALIIEVAGQWGRSVSFDAR